MSADPILLSHRTTSVSADPSSSASSDVSDTILLVKDLKDNYKKNKDSDRSISNEVQELESDLYAEVLSHQRNTHVKKPANIGEKVISLETFQPTIPPTDDHSKPVSIIDSSSCISSQVNCTCFAGLQDSFFKGLFESYKR